MSSNESPPAPEARGAETLPGPLDPSLARALDRLDIALGALENVARQKLAADRFRSDLEEAFAAMQDDRARLGLELDEALARARKLEAANDAVAGKLEAMARAFAQLTERE